MVTTKPGIKWERQLSEYRIMSDLVWADLTGEGNGQILAATSDDGQLHCLNGDGTVAWAFCPGGERFADSISVGRAESGSPDALIFIVSRYRSTFALDSVGKLVWKKYFPAASIFGGPTVAGAPGKEVILFGGDRGRLFAVKADGGLLWYFIAGGEIHGAPAAGDVDGDGRIEVFFGSKDYYLYSLRDDGSLRWRRKTRPVGDGVASSPILADIDGDGRVEVLCASWDHHAYCYDAENGTLKWEAELSGRIRNGLAVADLNNDGKLEVLVGDVSGMALLSSEGRVIWEFRKKDGEMVVAVPPVIGDVTGDGTPNVVFGTQTGSIYCLTADGELVWEHCLGEEEVTSAPLLADVDQDGMVEILFATSQGRVVCMATPAPAEPEPFWPMGRREPTLNPGLVPSELGWPEARAKSYGQLVSGGFEGGISVEPEREVRVDAGPCLWWECDTDYDRLEDASPLRLYVGSLEPEVPLRGMLSVQYVAGSQVVQSYEIEVCPSSGSSAVDFHLGGFGGGEISVDTEYRPQGGNPIRGPSVKVRVIARKPLMDRIDLVEEKLRKLKRPGTPSERLTRELVAKCLEYARSDASGSALGRAETMISELEEQIEKRGYAWDGPDRQPSRRVCIGPTGVVMVDDRPFFPLGLYNVHEPGDVRKLSDLGFNTIFNTGSEEFLDACDECGVMVIAHGPGENMQNFSSLNRIRERMEQLYWRPSLMAWYVVDEPSLRNVPVEVIRRASVLVKMIDPNRLTLICDGDPYRGKAYQPLADVASPAYYPVWKQMSLTAVARCVDDTVDSVPPEQPVWFVLQAWTWRNIRFPTPQEERVMAYLSLIHGARGLSWFAYKYPDKEVLLCAYEDSPELWSEIVRIVQEVRELEHMLLGPRPVAHVSEIEGTRVDWCRIQKDGQVLIIACNPGKVGASRAFEIGDADSVRVMWEDRSLPVMEGKLEDELPPMSVRVYCGRLDTT